MGRARGAGDAAGGCCAVDASAVACAGGASLAATGGACCAFSPGAGEAAELEAASAAEEAEAAASGDSDDGKNKRHKVHVGRPEFKHLEDHNMDQLCARVVVYARKPATEPKRPEAV